jgi:hypothetical protein
MKRFILAWILGVAGCVSHDVPPAHKARVFDKTGLWAFYAGGNGFTGPILGPGTVMTGPYPEVHMVECTQKTVKEAMTALTKDGVQFGLDMYVRYGANCDDQKAVEYLLTTLVPATDKVPGAETKKDDEPTIHAEQIYATYIRPALGEAVRESVSPHIANDVNAKREEIFATVRTRFSALMDKQKPSPVLIGELNLSNLDFPDEMDHANTERAVQSVLKDKAVAERERVTAEIETTKMRRDLAVTEADNDVARIVAIGKALHANPEYLQYDAQQRWNDIYFHAGEKGNLVIAAPVPQLQLPVRK